MSTLGRRSDTCRNRFDKPWSRENIRPSRENTPACGRVHVLTARAQGGGRLTPKVLRRPYRAGRFTLMFLSLTPVFLPGAPMFLSRAQGVRGVAHGRAAQEQTAGWQGIGPVLRSPLAYLPDACGRVDHSLEDLNAIERAAERLCLGIQGPCLRLP